MFIQFTKFPSLENTYRQKEIDKIQSMMIQDKWIQTTKKFDLGVKKELLIETGELYSNTEKFKQKMIAKFPSYDYISKGDM